MIHALVNIHTLGSVEYGAYTFVRVGLDGTWEFSESERKQKARNPINFLPESWQNEIVWFGLKFVTSPFRFPHGWVTQGREKPTGRIKDEMRES